MTFKNKMIENLNAIIVTIKTLNCKKQIAENVNGQ